MQNNFASIIKVFLFYKCAGVDLRWEKVKN